MNLSQVIHVCGNMENQLNNIIAIYTLRAQQVEKINC
jgi:hypothetical protein